MNVLAPRNCVADSRSTMATDTVRRIGSSLPRELMIALKKAVERDGDRAVALRLGLSRATITRAMAGLRIMPGSIALLRERLSGARAS
jgi:hypothetical protein